MDGSFLRPFDYTEPVLQGLHDISSLVTGDLTEEMEKALAMSACCIPDQDMSAA